MKKRLIQLALILGLMTLTCVAAQATETDEPTSGFRVVNVETAYASDVTLTPLNANNAEVKAADVRYPGAVKMKIAYTKATLGSEYLLCVLEDDGSASATPNADNMAYINQQTADGSTVEFTAFPKQPDSKTNSVKYSIYLSSNADAASGGVASFTKVATAEYYSAGLNVTLGDVDDDGEITIDDAYTALLMSVGLITDATEQQTAAADVDKDGDVTIDDAYNILLRSVGLIDSFDNL